MTLALQVPGEIYLPSIGLHEFWSALLRAVVSVPILTIRANTYNLLQFLKPPFQVLDFDGRDAGIAEEIRAELTRLGRPIGPLDTLIAGQALARGLTLVTANTREFARVGGLKIVDWTNSWNRTFRLSEKPQEASRSGMPLESVIYVWTE